ncbi:MAG: lamin tail domain-containing protein, partial [Planctomycetes bacterium]|nr:lamin tail domain-containing protein [Planctomycetota bacterium]
ADCPDDRGTLEHITITNLESDVAVLINFAIDELQFEATVPDTIPPPTIREPVVDSDTEVRVQCLDLASEAELYLNGGSVGTEVPVDGVATFTGLSLSIGNILTATQTANNITSAPSEPVVVMASAPTVEGPIDVGATSVTVSNVRPDADLVTVYVNTDTYPVDPAGQVVVVVPVDPIQNGSVVRATQTVDGTESPFSNAVIVGDFLVYVNEFNYDDSLEPDDHAFVELYNARDEAVDIGDWVIQVGDYIEGQDPPGVYYQVFIPPGTTIAAHGYWTVGMSAVADWPGAVVDLIDDNLRLDNGENYVALRLAGALVDAIAWEMNKSFTLIPADIYTQIGTGIWGNHVNWDNTNIENYEGPPTSQSRFLDGLDTDENGRDVGIQPATPGYSNNQPDLTPYFQNGSSLIALDPVPGWAFSYKPLIAFDPSVVDSGGVGGLPMNPSVIPPSPDEGLALLTWDEVGGGNVAYMGQLAKEDFTLETYIYIPPAFTPEGYEETKIGVRGSADGVHNFDWYNGATGVCWLLQHGATWQTLFLLDENDGDDGNSGDPICATIIGTIDIGTDAGLTGWQRLLLETSGDTVLGIFGGTYGSREDGIQFTATHECPGPGGVYISYREAVPGTATARPATFDAFSLTSPSACIGDVDGDGDTDLSDLAALLGAYGTGPGDPGWNPAADFDGDDDVDLSDLAHLLGDYGCPS